MDHSLWDARYVVIDVETTGSDPAQHRIIEIACLVVEAGQVSHRFTSLVNAHQPVPPSITTLTGITNSMLLTAPEEVEVFARVALLLAEPRTILVAHNAAFDRAFVLSTLKRLGYQGVDILPWLCTHRLARRLLPPTVQRMGLDGLIEVFRIPTAGRHRAEPDAETTVAVLQHLLSLALQHGVTTPQELLRLQYAPVRRSAHTLPRRLVRLLQQIPPTPGVYRFYNRRGQLLYIGKARNLAQRIRSHFTGNDGARRRLDASQIGDIRWEETPSELSALLRESEHIWTEQPAVNVLGKELSFAFVRVFLSEPMPRLEATQALPHGDDAWIGPLPSWRHALLLRSFLQRWYQLHSCPALCKTAATEVLWQRTELLLRDARQHLQQWHRQISAAVEQHLQQWEFEQAAALHSLWRILQRWSRARLPFEVRSCSFLLCLPLDGGALEVFRWHQGSFQGSGLVAAPQGLSTWLTMPAHVTPLSWLDIARLDILARWLAQHPQDAVLVPLPPDLSAGDVLENLVSQLSELLRTPPL